VAFYAIGNYAFAIVTAGRFSKALYFGGGLHVPPPPVWHDWMWLLLLVGLVSAMVAGVILGAPTLRLRGDYLAIVTLGFGEIVRIAARNFDSITVGPRGITSIPHPELHLFGLHYTFGLDPRPYYFLLLVLCALMIGVIMRLANLDGLMKKVGVDFVIVKAGRFKDLGNVARSMTPEERRILQVMLEDVHAQFIDAVAAGRRLDRAQVLGFADGRIVSGAQAKVLNMVDALGGLEEALDGAATLAGLSKPPRVIGPRRRLSIMDLLKNRLDLGTWVSLPPGLSVFKTPLYLMD